MCVCNLQIIPSAKYTYSSYLHFSSSLLEIYIRYLVRYFYTSVYINIGYHVMGYISVIG